MALLIMTAAAVTVTVLWYRSLGKGALDLSALCYMYWGASLMWMVDAVFEYAELGAEYFRPEAGDMLNDAFLGAAAVVFGLVIWMVILLVKDPAGRFRGMEEPEDKK